MRIGGPPADLAERKRRLTPVTARLGERARELDELKAQF